MLCSKDVQQMTGAAVAAVEKKDVQQMTDAAVAAVEYLSTDSSNAADAIRTLELANRMADLTNEEKRLKDWEAELAERVLFTKSVIVVPCGPPGST